MLLLKLFLFFKPGLELIDGHRRPWPSVPLLLAVMPLKILGYLRPKKGCPFPTWP